MNKTLGLYLHIPFCRSKCAYCDFYSVIDDSLSERYADALILHMEDYSNAVKTTISTPFTWAGNPPC